MSTNYGIISTNITIKIVVSKEEEVFEDHKYIPPVLIGEEYDIPNMVKMVTYRYVKHIYKDKTEGKVTFKRYSHSIITVEKYKTLLTNEEIRGQEKKDLIKSIEDEVSELDLSKFKTKKSIMKFACDNGKSNTERRRRAVILQKKLIEEQERLESESRLEIKEQLQKKLESDKEKSEDQLEEERKGEEMLSKVKKGRYELYKDNVFCVYLILI